MTPSGHRKRAACGFNAFTTKMSAMTKLCSWSHCLNGAKRNLGIRCALFTIAQLLGLGQGVRAQFQRIAWKLLEKLRLCNLFLPVSLVSCSVKALPHMTFFSFPPLIKSHFKMRQFFFLAFYRVSLWRDPRFSVCLSQPLVTMLLFFNVNLKR